MLPWVWPLLPSFRVGWRGMGKPVLPIVRLARRSCPHPIPLREDEGAGPAGQVATVPIQPVPAGQPASPYSARPHRAAGLAIDSPRPPGEGARQLGEGHTRTTLECIALANGCTSRYLQDPLGTTMLTGGRRPANHDRQRAVQLRLQQPPHPPADAYCGFARGAAIAVNPRGSLR